MKTIYMISIIVLLSTIMVMPATAQLDGVSEENCAVDNVVAAFDSLTYQGEWLGFYMGDAPYTRPLPTTEHFQGIARSPRVGIPIFYATRSGNINDPDYLGSLVVVELLSSNTDGERLGSNRCVKGLETLDTPPPYIGDKVIKNIPFDDYEHPGDIQMVGDILAVSLSAPREGQGLPEGKVVFFDCSNPRNPEPLPYELDSGDSVGVLGITKLPDGRFFMVVSGGKGTEVVFYKSNAASFFEPDFRFHEWGRLDETALQELVDNGHWRFGTTTPQSLNFVNQKDGMVYLIGSSNSSITAPFMNGEDHMFLGLVEGWDDPQNLRLVGIRGEVHKILRSQGCSMIFDIDHRQEANFNAGGGAYVSPTGELLYYGISHYNIGPEDTVNMAELRHKLVSHRGTCGPQFQPNHLGGPYDIDEGSSLTLDGTVTFIEPWVHMFTDSNFEGPSVMMDWRTQSDDDYDNFKKLDGCETPLPDGFNDLLSSFRFCGPEGSELMLYDDAIYTDIRYRVSGTDTVQQVSYVGNDADDEATSAQIFWSGLPANPYSWDLDNDGAFDDAYGPYATFRAGVHADYCGNSTNTVRMKYTYSTDGTMYEIKEATINVHNVPPTVQSVNIDDSTPDQGQEVTVTGKWTDPCATSAHVEVQWDVGIYSGKTWNTPTFSFSRVYEDVGKYLIKLAVSDGVDMTDYYPPLLVTVSNVAPVAKIESITDENGAELGIEEPVTLIGLTVNVAGSFTDVGTLKLHLVTMDWGDGTIEKLAAATGTIDASHIYTDLGDYTMTLTVTDDDYGVDTATAHITVVDGVGATDTPLRQMTPLADDPNIAAARKKLIGARKMLEEGKLIAGLGKIQKAIEYLEAAEAANPNRDLTDIKGILALIAKSVAVAAIEQAETLATKPNELRKIEQAKVLVAEGDALGTAADY
ncbi:MAG: PKD domain-containing protein, partial [Deltaproteobacteria bacterium]|nr:PKD domain-containing protein [Deltaproteobacteria bacterium]